MIKAEDLRIGDLVRYGKNIITVQAIHTNYEEGFIIDEYNVGYNCDELDPIPLTPEILEKNRYEVKYPEERYNKPIGEQKKFLSRYLAIEHRPTEWKVFIQYITLIDHVLLRSVKHVHELQHILWALGLDANLKI